MNLDFLEAPQPLRRVQQQRQLSINPVWFVIAFLVLVAAQIAGNMLTFEIVKAQVRSQVEEARQRIENASHR
jgi:hypothetical protein